jgi:hypothetical protein
MGAKTPIRNESAPNQAGPAQCVYTFRN